MNGKKLGHTPYPIWILDKSECELDEEGSRGFLRYHVSGRARSKMR